MQSRLTDQGINVVFQVGEFFPLILNTSPQTDHLAHQLLIVAIKHNFKKNFDPTSLLVPLNCAMVSSDIFCDEFPLSEFSVTLFVASLSAGLAGISFAPSWPPFFSSTTSSPERTLSKTKFVFIPTSDVNLIERV